MRNPNGYGTVVKLSGNRRNPFCARKTVDYNDKGHPIYAVIGYYPDRQAALIALAEYNHNPYDIDLSRISLKDMFERFIEREKLSGRLAKASIASHMTSFKKTAPLHDVPYKLIKLWQMQEIIDSCQNGAKSKSAIKGFFSAMDRYALEHEIITKSNAALIVVPSSIPSDKAPFTKEEIARVWEIAEKPLADSILILLYTGFRISELLALEVGNIDMDQQTFKGGTKTAAGKNRIIPIHPRILPFVQRRLACNGKYLFQLNGERINPNKYRRIFYDILSSIGIEHTPHECRHTFRSLLDDAGGNKKCIDLLMGHASKDIGERVYTHKTLDDLRGTIMLLD